MKEDFSDSFDCSYKTIANYVKKRKKEIFPGREGSLPLTHFAGAAQVDFGDADFYENGILHSGHYLTLSLPYSNSGYLQLFKGENLECLLTGIRKSLIITTNLEFGKWVNVFYDEIMTAAMIDRLIHHSRLIIFDGQSYRMKNSKIKH